MPKPNNKRRQSAARAGFTILESVIAITLLSVAAVMVFSVTYPAINRAYSGRNSNIAYQFATSLLDEILQLPNHSATMVAAAAPGLHRSRDSIDSIAGFDQYRSHMCLPDGTPLTAIPGYSGTLVGEDLCFQVSIQSVDASLAAGGAADFLLIQITAFEDPDGNCLPDGKPSLISLSRLVGEHD